MTAARVDREPGFTLLGIRIIATPGSLIGVGILGWLFSTDAPGTAAERWLLAAGIALLLYLSVLAHEFGHALTARRMGYPVHSIALHILGGWTRFTPTRRSPVGEGVIAAAGPAVTALFAAGAGTAVWLLRQGPGAEPWAIFLATQMLEILILLTVYNLLPGLPLDGGVILRSIVWAASGRERLGQRVAAGAGITLAAGLLSLPLVLWWRTGQPGSFWFIAVVTFGALWLFTGARQAWREVPGGTTAARVLPAISVRTGTPLSVALAQRAADPRGGSPALLVIDSRGEVIGLADPMAMMAVPLLRRPWVPVDALLRRDLGLPQLSEAERAALIVRDETGAVTGLRQHR